MAEKRSNIMFVELSSDIVSSGREIDGVATGNFIDMYGKHVTVDSSGIEPLVNNTIEMIEHTRGESGEVVGLPIDANNHDKGDAAGWIIGARKEGDLVRLSVRWTEIGKNLISKNIRKFFSATFDPVNLRIYGGTLTNWPATRGPNGNNLLRPVELSEGNGVNHYSFLSSESSMGEKISSIMDAFYEQIGTQYYITTDGIFDTYVIACHSDGSYWKIPFESMKEGSEKCAEFSPKLEWMQVKRSWVEMAFDNAKNIEGLVSDLVGKILKKETNISTNTIDLSNLNDKKEKENKKMDWSKLTPEEKEIAKKQVLAELATDKSQSEGIPADVKAKIAAVLGNPALAELANMDQVSTVLNAEVEKIVLAQLEGIKSQAGSRLAELVAELNHKSQVSELCGYLTNGSNPTKSGLPVKSNELESFLSSLSQKQYNQAEAMFKQILNGGLVEFGTSGVEGDAKVTEKLPSEIASKLRSKEIDLSDLSDPILGLGDITKFDLREFSVNGGK